MLDVNLHTLNFVRSTNEPNKLFLIEDSTGDPEYFRVKVPAGTESRIELYHAPTLAPLGVFQHLSSKLKLISLNNPTTTIELKNSGYIHFEWTFYFDKILKFCWRKDIVGLAGSKRGFTCWMSRKPDPDYPCAIYKPGSSTVPPFCQFLDFNIRRIDSLQDPRGLKYVILLSLLGFTEALVDQEVTGTSPEPLPRSQSKAPSAVMANTPTEPNELRITGHRSTPDLVSQGLKLFDDPLFLYLSVLAPSPKEFKQAINVAEQIKRDRLKKSGEDLCQYLVDDITSQEISASPTTSSSSRSTNTTSTSLKVYLSRTPLDELLPKSATRTYSDKSSRSSLVSPGSTGSPKTRHPRQPVKPLIPPKGQTQGPPGSSLSVTSPTSPLHSRLMTGVHRPFIKMISIASNSSRSSAFYHNHITPYYFEEEEVEEGTRPEVMPRQDEKVEDAVDTTNPVRLHRYRRVNVEQEQRRVTKSYGSSSATPSPLKKPEPFLIRPEVMPRQDEKVEDAVDTTNPVRFHGDRRVNVEHEQRRVTKSYGSSNATPSPLKKPEPFLICTNELNARMGSPVQMNRVLVNHRAHSGPDPAKGRTRASLDASSTDESVSHGGGTRSSTSSSGASIRSRTSTLRSTASSFVEIILSSCCSAYSTPPPREAKDNGCSRKLYKPPSPTRSRRPHLQSSPIPTWKRISHLGNRHSFVSQLFSSKIDTQC